MNSLQRRIVIWSAAVLVASAVLVSQTPEDRPPAVSPEQWVALSDNAGIVIKEKPRPKREAKGQLWVRIEGNWTPTVLEQREQVVPAR